MCAGSCRHGAFGLLAFSSMPSTWGASSVTASTASGSSSSATLANRGAVRGARARCRAAASAPGLGNPIAFTIARRRGVRTILGLGFPSLGARVIVPPTTNPKPSRPSASR